MQSNFMSALDSMIVKINTFFQRQQWKEIFIFMFFLMLSSGFWLLQILQQEYEKKIELQLRFKNLPAEWVLSESNPKKITVSLKDKGTTLIYYLWKSNFDPVDITITGLQRLTEQSLFISSSVLDVAVSKQLISSTSLISVDPKEIELKYDSLSSRLVTVKENINITTKPGFQLSDDIKFSQSEVRIFGSRSILDTLYEVRTKLIKLEDVSKTKELTAQLDLPKGVKAENETVKLTISVEEFTEKKLKIPVLCPDIPSDYVLRLFPSNVEVNCNIPLSQFRDLTEENLEIIIPFTEFEEKQSTGKISLRLTKKPSWVTNPVVIPDELEFIIEYFRHD